MRIQSIVITICLCTLATLLSARDQMRYVRYTTTDGLPASRVTTICEDGQGNLWMNTWNGICKWDGKSMTAIISTANGERFGRTNGMQVLTDGRLVFQNDNAEKMCFDPKTRLFCKMPDTLSFIPQHVQTLEYEELETGLEMHRNGVSYHISYDEGLRNEKQLHYLFEDSQGQIWADFNNTLYRIWFEPSPFCVFQHWPNGKHFQFQSTVRALSTNENGDLLAASRNYKMYGLNDTVTDVPYPGNVYEMVSDKKFDRIWLALRKKGLYIHTQEKGMHPAMPDLPKAGLSDLFSLLMLRDQPYLWCGTWGDGVRIVDIRNEKPELKRVLYNDSLTSVHKMIQFTNGLVGICSTRGFHIYSASGVPVYVVGDDLDVLSAVELPDERVYLCAMGKGQFYMETNGRLIPDVSTKINDRISSMYVVGDSAVWMVSDTRLFRCNYRNGEVSVMDHTDFGANLSFAENAITVCHDSLLYIGTSSGILEVNLLAVDDYLYKRDKAVTEASREHFTTMVYIIVLSAVLIAMLIMSVVLWLRYVVNRKVTTQIVRRVSPVSEEDVRQKDLQFVNKLHDVMSQMIGNQNADITQLSSLMGMSKNAFYVRCNEALHSTPAAILQDMRIEHAKELLEAGNVTVKEVSFRVGFNDPKYFSKVFKAKIGMTPSQFLEQQEGKK